MRTDRSLCRLSAAALLTLLAAAAAPGTSAADRTELLSNASPTEAGNGDSVFPAISPDGAHVVFSSTSSNLVPGDTNGKLDIFVQDRATGVIARVSVASDGSQANGDSAYIASISADGRYVAFESAATNLVPGDTNGQPDVFVHDRNTGVTERVSVGSDGSQGKYYANSPAISADGRYVAFTGSSALADNPPGAPAVFVRDRLLGVTEWVSAPPVGTAYSYEPSISADGRYVAFYALGAFVGGTNHKSEQVYVADRHAGTVEMVSVSSAGAPANDSVIRARISPDGRYVLFMSKATNLVSHPVRGGPSIWDVYLHDRELSVTELVSRSIDGAVPGNTSMLGAQYSASADGSRVVFYSLAANLVAGDANNTWDVFLRNRDTLATELVSLTSEDALANGASQWSTISADGRYAAFYSRASNLVADDANGSSIDVFVRDLVDNQPPVAIAGEDRQVEATALATPVTLDGSGSSDQDGDPLTFTWTGSFGLASSVSPVVLLQLGEHPIQMSVSDGNGGIASDSVKITVVDTTAPDLSVPEDITIAATGPLTGVDVGTGSATDIFEPVHVSHNAPAEFPVGDTIVTWSARDSNGNIAAAEQTISVRYVFSGLWLPHQGRSHYDADDDELPVRLELYYADGSPVTDAQPTIVLQPLTAGVPSGGIIVPTDADSPEQGNKFSYRGHKYRFEIDTRALPVGDYRIFADLGDGSDARTADITLRDGGDNHRSRHHRDGNNHHHHRGGRGYDKEEHATRHSERSEKDRD